MKDPRPAIDAAIGGLLVAVTVLVILREWEISSPPWIEPIAVVVLAAILATTVRFSRLVFVLVAAAMGALALATRPDAPSFWGTRCAPPGSSPPSSRRWPPCVTRRRPRPRSSAAASTCRTSRPAAATAR